MARLSALAVVMLPAGRMPVDAPFSHPAAITCVIVNPAWCATGVVDSAPRITDHVVAGVPPVFVTRISSDGCAGSPI